jgi:hypothetical protein
MSRQDGDEDMRDAPEVERSDEEEDEEDDGRAKIPPELITRVLHEFFTKEKGDTRITKDANEAVVKYVDVFVREAIARTAAEKEGGFLEVSFSVLSIFLVVSGKREGCKAGREEEGRKG